MKVFAFPTAVFYFIFSPVTALIMSISDLILKKFFSIEGDQIQFTFSKIELGKLY